MNRHNRRQKRNENTDDDLNLIPVMNLFVCLLPFLLLSAAFTQFGAVDTELPTTSGEKTEQAQQDRSAQKVELVFEVTGQQLVITGFQKGFSRALPGVKAKMDVNDQEALEAFLKRTKETYSEVTASIFKVDAGVPYETAVNVLGQLRKREELPPITLAAEAL